MQSSLKQEDYKTTCFQSEVTEKGTQNQMIRNAGKIEKLYKNFPGDDYSYSLDF